MSLFNFLCLHHQIKEKMNKGIRISIKNAYGIESFDESFFTDHKTSCIIYAPNGVGKTSFANIVRDYESNSVAKTNEISGKKIEFNLSHENQKFLVVESMMTKKFTFGNSIFSLNPLLSDEINKEKEEIITLLNTILYPVLKEDIYNIFEKEINKNFTCAEFINWVNKITNKDSSEDLENIFIEQYKVLFNKKIHCFMSDKTNYILFEKYIKKYTELVEGNGLLDRKFGEVEINKLNKTLEDINFFNVGKIEIKNRMFQNIEHIKSSIKEEIQKIYNTPELIEIKNEIEKRLDISSDETRNLKSLLLENPEIFIKMGDYKNLSKKVVSCILKKNKKKIEIFIEKVENFKNILPNIDKELKEWNDIINNFENLFKIPIEIKVVSKKGEIINDEERKIEIKFKKTKKNEQDILKLLSQGEKRAFYLLDVLFSIHNFQKKSPEGIIVFDDIIDSFDYNNKQAIINLMINLEKDKFKFIVLTHSFDFFRALNFKLNCTKKILQKKEQINKNNEKFTKTYLKGLSNELDIFKEFYKEKKINDDVGYLFSFLCFVRQTVKYKRSERLFNFYTKCLHIKRSTSKVKINDIYKKVFRFCNFDRNEQFLNKYENKMYLDELFLYCDHINRSVHKEDFFEDFKNKICLAIGIRLKTELFLKWYFKNNQIKIESNNNQTVDFIVKFNEYNKDKNLSNLLIKINTYTSETIHLNSFMIEPLLDIKIDDLISLYNDIKSLKI